MMKAAVGTDVTVDLKGLDCTLCLDPLQPPAFQPEHEDDLASQAAAVRVHQLERHGGEADRHHPSSPESSSSSSSSPAHCSTCKAPSYGCLPTQGSSKTARRRARSTACAAGHVICSACYEKLLKDYCQLCSINTSYSRCFAVERTLLPVNVICSNAGYGCTAKMSYHEKEEHEKQCPKAVCDCIGSNDMQPTLLQQGLSADCYALLIPKVSLSTSINISINNGEIKKKIHDIKNSTDSVVKMGPCGGVGGNAWKRKKILSDLVCGLISVDLLQYPERYPVIRSTTCRSSKKVRANQFADQDGKEEETKLWGGRDGGKRSEIHLKPGEYFTSVKGHYGLYNNLFLIRSLTFVSNHQNYGPYGKEEGWPFKLPAAGGKIIGFHGHSDSLLDALGTYVKLG